MGLCVHQWQSTGVSLHTLHKAEGKRRGGGAAVENGRRRGSEGGGRLRLVKTGPSHPCRLCERPYHTRRTCEGSHT